MKKVFFLFIFIFSFLFSFSTIFSITNVDIKILDSEKTLTLDQDFQTFEIAIKNNRQSTFEFILKPKTIEGWRIEIPKNNFILQKNEEKKIILKIFFEEAYSKFKVIRKTENKIDLKSTAYNLEIPFIVDMISKKGDSKQLNFKIKYDKRIFLSQFFKPTIKNNQLNSNEDLIVFLKGLDYSKVKNIDFKAYIGNKELKLIKVIPSDFNYYTYQFKLPNLDPKDYTLNLYLNHKTKKTKKVNGIITILPSSNLIIKKIEDDSFSIWSTKKFHMENKGNVEEISKVQVNFSSIDLIFLESNIDLSQDINGTYFFVKKLKPNETFILIYKLDYIVPLTLFIIFLSLIFFKIFKILTIPLNTEVIFSTIKKEDMFNIIDRAKVKLKVENLKSSSLNKVNVIIKIPIYLKVVENSFLISEPSKVIVGNNFYKLVWRLDFLKGYETRFLGFILKNENKIIGDISLPDIQIQIKEEEDVKNFFVNVKPIK